MTRNELIDNRYYDLHHTAYRRGYVSRKLDNDTLIAHEYAGRFGEGYTVDRASRESSQYCLREYWIRKEA